MIIILFKNNIYIYILNIVKEKAHYSTHTSCFLMRPKLKSHLWNLLKKYSLTSFTLYLWRPATHEAVTSSASSLLSFLLAFIIIVVIFRYSRLLINLREPWIEHRSTPSRVPFWYVVISRVVVGLSRRFLGLPLRPFPDALI